MAYNFMGPNLRDTKTVQTSTSGDTWQYDRHRRRGALWWVSTCTCCRRVV